MRISEERWEVFARQWRLLSATLAATTAEPKDVASFQVEEYGTVRAF